MCWKKTEFCHFSDRNTCCGSNHCYQIHQWEQQSGRSRGRKTQNEGNSNPLSSVKLPPSNPTPQERKAITSLSRPKPPFCQLTKGNAHPSQTLLINRKNHIITFYPEETTPWISQNTKQRNTTQTYR